MQDVVRTISGRFPLALRVISQGRDVFAECEEGFFDGFRLDTQGRIWTSARDGVRCYHPDGALLGKIFILEVVSNVCFGGPKRDRLFITAFASVYTVLLPTTGTSPV